MTRKKLTHSGNIRIHFFLVVILVFFYTPCYSQDSGRINLTRIGQKNIRKYIKSRSLDQLDNFSSIHSSWKKGTKSADFHVDKKTFYLGNRLKDVWDGYRHANLRKSWNGHSVRFGLLISKRSNSVFYTNSIICPEVDTGQVYFLNLRIMKGLFHVPVAFEIINIDPVEQKLEFSYLDDNKSIGKQTMQFFDNGDGRTKIVHTTLFRSNSSFRDAFIYPYFHHRLIREFHRNMELQVHKT